MIILDYDKNENFKLDTPKINKPKKKMKKIIVISLLHPYL